MSDKRNNAEKQRSKRNNGYGHIDDDVFNEIKYLYLKGLDVDEIVSETDYRFKVVKQVIRTVEKHRND